jgi:thymidylate synthase ThyX
MNASLVYDGTGEPEVPESMGTPAAGQLRGTPAEKLGELACRICYDSLGNGRSSAKLHEHILEVKNLSVYEHINFTTVFRDTGRSTVLLVACLNRKGVWVEMRDDAVEITANLRAVLEWDRHTRGANAWVAVAAPLGQALREHASRIVPQIVKSDGFSDIVADLFANSAPKTENLTADQAWITLYLYGSRGFTHEQVRHRFAMSQRSTRYVDEDGSPYVTHPLVVKYLAEADSSESCAMLDLIEASTAADRLTYRVLVDALRRFCRGPLGIADPTAARKQARGAARGYLGNALASEMLFSAPASGWRWILEQRASRFADAEIRSVYGPALAAL